MIGKTEQRWWLANAVDLYDQTLLHLAARYEYNNMAKILIEANKVDVNVRRHKDGRTPLHYATKFTNRGCAKILIDCGADVNVQDFTGTTPLHLAAQFDSVECARLLLEDGKAFVDAKTDIGRTPLHRAAQVSILSSTVSKT